MAASFNPSNSGAHMVADNARVPSPLSIPDVEWRDGSLWSVTYQDWYASSHGARAEREHVFLRAHGYGAASDASPGRWAQHADEADHAQPDRFTFAELGFGAGLSFLVTWRAFRAHVLPRNPNAVLEWISVEGAPLSGDQLLRAGSADADTARDAQQLAAAWPHRIPGLHRRTLDGGRVKLTLLFGAPLELLPHVSFAADAWNLDGFAPSRNPEMWSDDVMAQLAAHSTRGTTVATYSAASSVRTNLERAGFTVELRPGIGAKRQITTATWKSDAPLPTPARRGLPAWFAQPAATSARADQRVIVVGAGLAGASAARALAERGFAVTVIESGAVASGGSGAPRAILSPHLANWNGIQARGVAQAFLFARAHMERLAIPFDTCGLLHALSEDDEWAHESAIAEWGWPRELLRLVSAQEASEISGVQQSRPAIWVALACATQPQETVRALLNHPAISVHEHATVTSLRRAGSQWEVATEGGSSTGRSTSPAAPLAHTAPIVILATAGAWRVRWHGMTPTVERDAPLASSALPDVPFDGTRGQLTFVQAATGNAGAASSPRTILLGQGFIVPPHSGSLCIGATHERGNDSLNPTTRDDALNLQGAEALAPEMLCRADAPITRAGAWVGLRATVNDHLPVIGAVPNSPAFAAAFARLCHGPFADKWTSAPLLPGLFCSLAHGSRGTSTALLAGELLADIITGSVRCLADDMLPAFLPQRFQVRALRRGDTAAVP